MEPRIHKLINILFEDIPYSEETFQAQNNIQSALDAEYEALRSSAPAGSAFELLFEKYHSLPCLAALAGYTDEDVKKWRTCGEIQKQKPLKKEFARARRWFYLLSIFAALTLSYLFISIWQRQLILLSALCAFLTLLTDHRCKRFFSKEVPAGYDTGAFLYLRALSDQYRKRKMNSIFIFFAVVFLFFLSQFSLSWYSNSKSAEVVENILASLYALVLPLYLCIKNTLCLHLVRQKMTLFEKEGYKKHLLGISIFSAVYWLLVTAVLLIFKDSIRYPGNLLFFAGLLFSLFVLLYNITFRRRVTYQNIAVNKKRIAFFTCLALFASLFTVLQKDTWYTQPYINSIPVVTHGEQSISYNELTGVYTITTPSQDFKILHLTDIHLGGSLYSLRKDLKALHAVYQEIAHTHPDLVVVTGDLTFPMGIMSMSLNNSAPVGQFAAFMRNIGIPWAFTYGNHDTESIATTSEKDLNELYKSFSYKTSGNLLYPYTQPDITGRNNQLIEIRNSDGSLMQALFLIDSNAYTGAGINVYDYIHDDQVDWYAKEVARLCREEGRTIPSMAFFHIPLQEYRTAYELYEQESDEVTWFFGENGEKMIDKICCSDYPSKLFDTMLELGSTKAVFCGHDHYNNMSLEYKGIRLTYGMSIDYLAMPGIEHDTAQRGAELITLHADGSFDLVQIPLTSISK